MFGHHKICSKFRPIYFGLSFPRDKSLHSFTLKTHKNPWKKRAFSYPRRFDPYHNLSCAQSIIGTFIQF